VVTRCAPQDYYLERPLDDEESLWWLYVRKVVPATLFAMLKEKGADVDGATPIFIQGTGALRYSLLGPVVVVDDIIAVSPFENPVVQTGTNLTAQQLNQVFAAVQADGPAPKWGLVNFGVAGERPEPQSTVDSKRYDLYTVEFHAEQVLEAVKQALTDMGYVDVADSLVAKPVYRPGSGDKDYHRLHSTREKREPLDATDFWFDFVRNEWRCPDDKADHQSAKQWLMIVSNSPTNESIPSEMATIAAVFLILLYAFASLRRQKTSPPQRTEVALQLTERPSSVTGESTPLLWSQQ
jgi:hypothetical protein